MYNSYGQFQRNLPHSARKTPIIPHHEAMAALFGHMPTPSTPVVSITMKLHRHAVPDQLLLLREAVRSAKATLAQMSTGSKWMNHGRPVLHLPTRRGSVA